LDKGVGVVQNLGWSVWVAGCVCHFGTIVHLGDDEFEGFVGIPFFLEFGVIVREFFFGEPTIVGKEMFEDGVNGYIVETCANAGRLEIGFFNGCGDLFL
jgi:hypothetical protein